MTLPGHMRFCLSAPLPTSVWVGDELIVHTNDEFAAFVGTALHTAVLGRPAREGFGTLWPVLQPLVERAPSVTSEVRLLLPRGGELTEVFATIALSRSEDGIVCTCIDTTESVRARRRLAAQDQILALVAHDLRGQLASAKTTVDLIHLTGDSRLTADVDAALNMAVRSLDGMLEYSRIARGTLAVQREPVEVSRILARAVELAGAPATRLENADSIAVVADAERIASAVAQLLVQGAEHALAAEVVGDRLRIIVRCPTWRAADLAPCLARDFAPQTRIGLALAFARTMVEHLGGAIIAHETAVVLEVPVKGEAPVWRPRRAAVHSRSRKRVLLVEDHDDAARSLKAALELLGYEVAIAHDGPVALTVARAFHPDVALLDIGLPVMDGYELANRLRSVNGPQRELHVVAVTAYGSDEFKRRSRELGFAEHLVKPVDLARLERIVEALD